MASIFNTNSTSSKYSLLPRSTAENPNLINPNQNRLSALGATPNDNPNNRFVSSGNYIKPSLLNSGISDKQKTDSQMLSANVNPTKDPRPNVGNNLLKFGKSFSDFAGSPFGTGFAEGVGKYAGYSTMPTSFGQALSSGLASGNANQLAFANAQPDKFVQFVKDGKLFNRNLNTGEVTQVGGKGMSVTNVMGSEGEFNDEFAKALGKDTATDISKLRQNSELASQSKGQIDRYRGLMMGLEDSDFGALSGIQSNTESILNSLGLLDEATKNQLGNKEALTSISGNFVLGFVQQTKGAISEREMAYFMMISAGLGRSKRGNELILNYMEKINNRTFDKEKAVDALLLNEEFQTANQYRKNVMYRETLREIEQQNLFTSENKKEMQKIYKEQLGVDFDDKSLTQFEKYLQDDDLTLGAFEIDSQGNQYVTFTEDLGDGSIATEKLYLNKEYKN